MAIGANAVVFSVMNGLILWPLQTPRAESLYTIERASDRDTTASYPDYRELRTRNRSFEDLAAYSIPQAGLESGEGPVATWGVEATGNYFDALGIKPLFGRFFHDSDERGPNSAQADVVSVVVRMSLVQLETPDEMRGRVSAVNSLFIGTSNQLGEFESGVTASWFGLVPTTIIGGVGSVLVAVIWIKAFPALWKLESLGAAKDGHP